MSIQTPQITGSAPYPIPLAELGGNFAELTVNNMFRKQKFSIKKIKSNDRRVRLQNSLIRKTVNLGVSVKPVDNVGIDCKRSLKITYKTLNKTSFRTTNFGRKRLNARSIKLLNNNS